MKPAFSYYGGKQRLVAKLLPLIPRHTAYIEPFCGGASLLFRKPIPKMKNVSYYRECVNDLNGNVVNFFRVLRETPDELIHLLELTPCSRYEHDVVALEPTDDPVEKARRWFVDIRQGVLRQEHNGWAMSTAITNNDPIIFCNSVAHLKKCAERLRGVYVEHRDALDVIRQWDSPTSFFYLDPPYPETAQGHYDGYTLDNFKELVKLLHEIQGSWMLSCYEQDGVEFADDVERIEFDAFGSAAAHNRTDSARTEVVWRRLTNQDHKHLERPEFSIFDS